ncbi:MAG: hypothetical protein HP491_15820 [Nitrospira sp.]|nr:hypothetical protein [Nitrospira sp.]
MSAVATMTAQAFRGQTGGPRLHGTILAVDDDEPIRNLFLELFRSEGVSIRAAGSGRDAIAMVKQSPR